MATLRTSQPRLTLARSRDQYSIPRRAPGPNACAPRPSHPPPGLPESSLPPPLLRRLLTCLSTCALPSTVTNQPPPSPPHLFPTLAAHPLSTSRRHLAIPVSVCLRVFPVHRCSLSLLSSIASVPPLLIHLLLFPSRRISPENISFCSVVALSRLFLKLFVYREYGLARGEIRHERGVQWKLVARKGERL